MTPFAKQTTLVAEPATPGRYHVDVDPRWNCPVVPQGGIMVAIAAKAMAIELDDPGQRLRSLTTVFAGQVPSGPVTIDVRVLRRGRSISQAMVDVRAPGADAGHTTVAVFGRSRAGFEFTDLRVAATFAVARAECHDQVRLIARSGDAGNGDWQVAILSRLPVVDSRVLPLEPQLPRDPGRRALLVTTVEAGARSLTVCGTHLPLLKDPVWRLAPSLRRALPPPERPAALAGDMNMWGWCIDRLVGNGWRRAVRGRTYPARQPHSQTDHILVSRPVEVVEAQVVRQVRSDHRPIRARLRF